MRRLPFLFVTIGIYIAFVVLVNYWDAPGRPLVQKWALNLLIVATLPLKFIALGRRLHDIQLSSFFGTPVLLLMATAVYNNYAVNFFGAPNLVNRLNAYFPHSPSVVVIAGVCLIGIIVLTDLALFVMPGSKAGNIYGPPPEAPASDVAKHF